MEKVAKCDAGFRDSSPNSELFLNIYRVLLTRIKNGILFGLVIRRPRSILKKSVLISRTYKQNPCRTVARQGFAA